MQIVEEQMKRHKLAEQLEILEKEIVDNNPMEEQQRHLDGLDKQYVEIRRHTERCCRKILKPDLEFSLEVKVWNDRMNAWRELMPFRFSQSGPPPARPFAHA